MTRQLFLRDLEPGRLYRIAVRAAGPNGAVSDWSPMVDLQTTSDTIAPKAPSGLSWTVEGTSFKATWVAPTQSEDNSALADLRDYEVTIYQTTVPATKAVYYTNATRFDFSFEANAAAFTTAKPNLTIEVRGRDHSGNVSQTPVTATATNPAPSTPANASGVAIQDGISLKWDAVTDADLKEYRVYNGTTLAGATNLVFKGVATSFTHNSFAYSTDQYYKITSVDVFGSESASANLGPIKPKSPFTVDTIAPAVPAGLAATLTNASDGKTASAAVSWTAVTDTDGDLSEYIVGYKPSAASDWQYVKVDYTNTSVRIDNLLPYANYDFRIRSSDWAANLSAWSSVVTKTAVANTAPATVAGVAIIAGKDSVTVSWTENTETDVVNGAGVYMVDIAKDSAFTTGLLSYRTGSTNITVSGLAQGTVYYARVKAVDSLGLASTSWSTVVNATTGTLASQFTYTRAATAPSNPNTGDIWFDTTTGFEKQWTGSGWVNTGNASTSYVDTKTNSLIKTYTNEYAVNSSETVAPTTGWSTATPTRTAGTFVWFRTTVTTSDGSTSTTSPALLTGNTGATGSQGIQGPAGANGVSLYTWLKYADTPTTGMSDSPTGKTYMGIAYNKTSATESNVYSDYEWSLIKGTDGIQGPAGADGQTTYTWVKYADDVNGAGMSDSPTGKTYIGFAFNKTTATESTVATDYQWSLIQGPQGPQGTAGTPAKVVSLTATSQVLTSPSGGGATNPATTTVTGTATNTTITVWEYAVDGGAFSATVPAGVSRTGNVVTITGSTMTARTITVRMADAGGVADTLTVAKVLDGAAGSTGGTGAAGADAYTVVLTNEAQVFPGSTTAANAGSATTAVIAYKGATQIPATIGTITGQVTGLTTAITNNGTNNATVTITVTTALTTQSGTLTIPLTVDGKSFTKTFAWSVSYTGATGSQGPTGNTGATGVGISSVTPYFAQVTTGAAAPAKPTTATPSAPWVATEPAYVANTELYRTEKVLYTDATFAYTAVSKVSSYTASTNAIAAANGKNKVVHSTGDATGTAYVDGDTWFKYDGSNNIVAQWRFLSGAWVSEQIASAVIANLDAGKLTAGSAFVTTLNIGTGGVIQSAGYTDAGTSGFKLSTSGLTIKGSGNSVDVAALTAGTISGKIITVGAGGSLVIDATGELKSNNWSSLSTGYRLGSSGLEVNDGVINAKALSSGTISSATITLSGANGKVVGTGFELSGAGLTVTSGVISAAALQLQNGHNMMPAPYSDFEYGDSYYISSFWTPRGQGKLAIVGGGLANSNLADANTKPVTGLRYLGLSTLGNPNALEGWFGTSTTDYNINVDPGQKYIVSGYFKNNSANNSQWNLVVKGNDGSTLTTLPIDLGGGVSQTTWTRRWATFTIPASGVSKVIVGVTNPDTTVGKDFHVDAMQFEPITGGMTTPSVWKPPAQTTIDASGVTTGMMRSNLDTTVGSNTVPVWSLNKDGNLQVGDALVRGKLIVGSANDLVSSRINNGNFEGTDITNTAGFQTGSGTLPALTVARTTTAGEIISGSASLKISSTVPVSPNGRIKMGATVNLASAVAGPADITIEFSGMSDEPQASNANSWGWYVGALDSANVEIASDNAGVFDSPAPNVSMSYKVQLSIPSGKTVSKVAIAKQAFASTTTDYLVATKVIIDDIEVASNLDSVGSFAASYNFQSGEGGIGWRIDGAGNVEFNSGVFRGSLGAGIVTADTLASDMVMSSAFRTGIKGQQRVEFDSTGINMYDATDTAVIQLPTDPSAKATFSGDLVASSLTVQDLLAIRGDGNEISKGSTVTLQSGTTAPSSPPTVTVDWKTIPAGSNDGYGPYRYGVTVQGGWFRVPVVVYGQGTFVESYSLTDGTKQWGSLNTAANNGMWNALGGITSIGNNVYLLGTNQAGQWRLMGFTFGTGVSGTPTRLFDVAYPQSSDHRIPALGNDGTNLLVVLTNTGSNVAQVRSFSATNGSQLTSALVSDLNLGADMAFVNKGAFDNGWGLTSGTPVYVIGSKASATAYVLDQNFKRLSGGGYDFPLIAKPAGQTFYNGKFYTYDNAGYRITEHTGATWNSTSAGYDKWYAAMAWYNSTGPYETMIGPIAGFTMKKRARAVITSPPIPKALGVPEDVKAVGLYMARGSTTPTRTYFQRQTYLADGVRTIKMQEDLNVTMPNPGVVNSDSASQPKASSNFPATTPGAIKDAAGRFALYGDGSGNWAGITVSNTGVLDVTANSLNAPSGTIVLGDQTVTTSRTFRIFKKATSGTNYYESRQYLYDGGATSGWANVIYENGAESARIQFNPVDGRMLLKNTTANVTRNVPIVDTGSYTQASVAPSGGAGSTNITFNTGRFTAVPTVTAVTTSGRLNVAVTAVSQTGATILCNNWTTVATGATVYWTAVQE